jgi:uncharacterized cupin superfamily protein
MNFFPQKLLPALAVGFVIPLMPLHGQPTPAVPPPARPGSAVCKWEDLKVTPTGAGVRRDVMDRPTATLARFECHVTTLNPGNLSHPPHRHPQEELIILQAGTLAVSINGRVTTAGPGSLFFFAADDLHNMTNTGAVPATYFVFSLYAPPGATAGPARLGSTVFDWTQLAVQPTKTGARRDVVDAPTATLASFECHITTLNPGVAPHPPHHHPDEEFVLVKEGSLGVMQNGGTSRAGAGSVLFCASNEEHGWHNAGAVPVTYYVFRVVTAATPKA